MASKARERLVDSVIDLARRDGLAGLSVADVLTASGVARQSFYNHFPGGTDELAVEAVVVAGRWIDAVVEDCCRRPPLEALDGFVASWARLLEEGAFQLGCPVSAGAQLRHRNPAAADAAEDAFRGWEGHVAGCLARAGIAPAVSRRLAGVIVVSVEGAVLRCLAAGSAEPLSVVREFLRTELVVHLAGAVGGTAESDVTLRVD